MRLVHGADPCAPGGASRPPSPLSDDVEAVEAAVLREVARRRAVLEAVDARVGGVVDAIDDLAVGGKRIRARFALLGARGAAGGAPVPGAVGVATAVELFHLAALVHDDVMDHADERRGVPTVHRVFGARSEDFGRSVAVLAGDLLLTWADDVLARATQPVARGAAVREVWSQMRDQVLAGQFLDLRHQMHDDVGSDEVVRMVQFKSAKYTVEHPLRLGGALAGAPAELLDGYGGFGLAVGEAFQLRDDLLDLEGDARVTGKAAGGDLREGKRTLLVALALERATPAQLDVLRRHLGDAALDERGVGEVRDVLDATGALRRVEERIDDLVAQAHDVLAGLTLDAATRDEMAGLADAAAWRTR